MLVEKEYRVRNAARAADPQLPIAADKGSIERLKNFLREQGSERARRRLQNMLFACDVAAIAACGMIADLLLDRVEPLQALRATVIFSLFYFPFAILTKAYSRGAVARLPDLINRVANAAFLAVLAVSSTTFLLKQSDQFSRVFFVVNGVATLVALIAVRMAVLERTRRLARASAGVRLLFVDGCPAPAKGFDAVVDMAGLGIKPSLTDPNALMAIGDIVENAGDIAVLATPERRRAWIQILQCFGHDAVILMPEVDTLGSVGARIEGGKMAFIASFPALSTRDQAIKRLFDLTVLLMAAPIVVPVMMVAAIAVRLDSPGPALFEQQRIGQRNRRFSIYKFRSMRTDLCDHDGDQSTLRTDPRVTRVGKFIRATSIDELPQLLNVLKGEMSIVGPRPHALGSRAGGRLFWEVCPTYWQRHVLKPGLTGLAQVRGHRGATDHEHELEDRLESDLHYCENWSLYTDLAIIARTVGVLVHRKAF